MRFWPRLCSIFWPRSLLGRNVLLLLSLVVASQVCVIVIFVTVIQKPRIDDAASLIASQVLLTDRLFAALPAAQRQQTLLGMHAVADADMSPSGYNLRLPSGYRMRRFFARLDTLLPPNALVRWEDGSGADNKHNAESGHRLWMRLRVDGQDVWIPLPATPILDSFAPASLLWLLLTLAALPTLGAYLIHYRIQGPLQRLARAAANIERGHWPDAVPVEGPLELATVTEAFNRMMQALADMEATRAEMLAGISHDLRTPLTKLRMAIAAPESFDAPVASAERFIEEIDAIVQQFIDFARGSVGEEAAPGDLNALIEQLAADYTGLGHPFDLRLGTLPMFAYRPVGIQRLIMNLMQNAMIHGRTGLSVGTCMNGGFVTVTVADRGSGIPASILPLVKQPFRRGGHEKNGAGTGLGLAIADRIARQHGGMLDLECRPGGGLSAIVKLPVPGKSNPNQRAGL